MASDYQKAVATLYEALPPRQLLAYLDQRLRSEDLVPEMRISGQSSVRELICDFSLKLEGGAISGPREAASARTDRQD
jgi:hypothetical protein